MSTVLAATCPACGVVTKAPLGWLEAYGAVLCRGCTDPIHLDAEELSSSFTAIDAAMRTIDEATEEIGRPRELRLGLSFQSR
ncbi:MAG TPA: hypothetical protein VF601_04425 [Beijerinckiaceae bacterium]